MSGPAPQVRVRARRTAQAAIAAGTEPSPADDLPMVSGEGNPIDAAAVAEPDAATPCGPDPDEAHLRAVFSMWRRGRTQAQIGVHFGVTDRTVRRWLDEAKGLIAQDLKDTTPETELANAKHLFAALRAELWAQIDTARAEGKTRFVIDAVRELRALGTDEHAMLAKLGFFTPLRFDQSQADDPHAQRAEALRAVGLEIMNVLAGRPANDETLTGQEPG